MMAWPTLASYGLRHSRLVSPFPKPIPNGQAYWLVAPRDRPASAKVKAFDAWIRAELADDLKP